MTRSWEESDFDVLREAVNVEETLKLALDAIDQRSPLAPLCACRGRCAL